MHAIDVSQTSARVPIHQRFTLLSSSTPQFSVPLYNITRAVHALYQLTLSSITTNKETRDNHILQLYLHVNPHNLTLTQFHIQETDYHLQIHSVDSTKDHLFSRFTKATNLMIVGSKIFLTSCNYKINLFDLTNLNSSIYPLLSLFFWSKSLI